MAVGERDRISGHMTTGHEWNGILELNSPVPKPVWIALTLTFLFALGYWLLMPAWPLGGSYTKGLLGIDQRQVVTRQVGEAARARSAWTGRIAAMDFNAIRADPALMANIREDGRRLFGDNCAACHGVAATGGEGFPNLTDHDWLWGGDPATVTRTISGGVNAPQAGTRTSQMLAFGRDGMLDFRAIDNVAHYVLALSDPAQRTRANEAAIRAGGTVFAANCASCHGANGRGNPALGAPNLADHVWIYGDGDLASIYTTIDRGRQGQMPAWAGRLSPLEIKILTLYVLDRGVGRP
jgi:cytochrome c oxidase cbb3-type subunit 3